MLNKRRLNEIKREVANTWMNIFTFEILEIGK